MLTTDEKRRIFKGYIEGVNTRDITGDNITPLSHEFSVNHDDDLSGILGSWSDVIFSCALMENNLKVEHDSFFGMLIHYGLASQLKKFVALQLKDYIKHCKDKRVELDADAFLGDWCEW